MTNEISADDVDEPDRLTRARTEGMEIHKRGPHRYDVVNEEGTNNYEIDLAEMTCDCRDYRRHSEVDICKHLWKGLQMEGRVEQELRNRRTKTE